MASFKDKAGRAWRVEIDLDLADEVLAQTDIDLIDVEKMDATFSQIYYGAPRPLVKMLWVMVREQAERDGVTEKDFNRAINSEALRAGAEALAVAIADFSPRAEVVQAKIAAFQTMLDAADKHMAATVKERVRERVDENLRAVGSGSSAGKSPGASPATRAPTPSANSA